MVVTSLSFPQAEDGVQDMIQTLADILRQKPQHEIAVFLKKEVLPVDPSN